MNLAVQPPVRAVHVDFAQPHAVRVELVVPMAHFFVQGHFPEVALLPGVVQLTWAVELARCHLHLDGEFVGVNALKFMRVIQPEQPVTLALQLEVAIGQLQFEYFDQDGIYSSGTVLFAARVASA